MYTLKKRIRQAFRLTAKVKHYSLKDTLPWGKYTGKTMEEIAQLDPGYIFWMVDSYDYAKPDLMVVALAKLRKEQIHDERNTESTLEDDVPFLKFRDDFGGAHARRSY